MGARAAAAGWLIGAQANAGCAGGAHANAGWAGGAQVGTGGVSPDEVAAAAVMRSGVNAGAGTAGSDEMTDSSDAMAGGMVPGHGACQGDSGCDGEAAGMAVAARDGSVCSMGSEGMSCIGSSCLAGLDRFNRGAGG